MISRVVRTWAIVARRMASDWLMLAAAATTILLATTLLAASPIYSDAVNVASLRRTLTDRPVNEANLSVAARGQSAAFAGYDATVRELVGESFQATGAEVFSQVTAAAYELPFEDPDGVLVEVASIEYLEGIADHASLVDGSWPGTGGEPHQLAVQTTTADRLGLDVGDTLSLTSRQDESIVAAAVIVGVFEAHDPSEPFWYGDPLIGPGSQDGPSFRVNGPFVGDLETVLQDFSPRSSSFHWKVYPNHQNLTVDGVSPTRRQAEGLADRLNETTIDTLTVPPFSVNSTLPASLREAEQSVVVARTNVLMLAVQLAVIAGYALMHTSGLLVEGRQVETGLLRSRGAGNGQILTVSIMEGILITLPAALLAPWLATQVLELLNVAGPLASIGLSFDPEVNRTAYVLSFLAAAGCVAALAIPAYRSSRTFNESYIALGRQQRRGYAQRAGIDLALLVLAVVAFWQLKSYGPELSSTVRGRLGLDPLLIAAPALGLLAGGMLALRLVPLLARLGERVAGAKKTTVPALSAWQVARRPLRYSRAALLLTMAVGVGFFAAAYATTWTLSQEDQAAFQVGADLRLIPNRRAGAITDVQMRSAHENQEGVNRSIPVRMLPGQLSRTGKPATFFSIDTAHAADVVTIRDDLTETPFPELMSRLAAERPHLASVPLSGDPEALSIRASLTSGGSCFPPSELTDQTPPEDICFAPTIRMVLQDGDGLLHRVTMGRVEEGAPESRLMVPLARELQGGATASPAYPLSIVALEIAATNYAYPTGTATLHIAGIDVSDRPGGGDWRPIDFDPTAPGWLTGLAPNPNYTRQPSITSIGPPGSIEYSIEAGESFQAASVVFGIQPPQTPLPTVFPTVVSTSVLEETGIAIGDEINLQGLRIPSDRAVVVGTVDVFPTVRPEVANTVIVDMATIQMLSYTPGGRIDSPVEYWVDTTTDELDALTVNLKESPIETIRVTSRSDRATTLQSDPIALGTIALLSLGFIAAGVLAAVGFIVSAVASARERVGEFTLLRALGLSKRQLGAWLTIEQAVLVCLGLVFGTIVGLVLVALILPLISVTQRGVVAIPDLIVVYPFNTILLLDLMVILVLLGVVAVLSGVVRRQGLAEQLRIGDA